MELKHIYNSVQEDMAKVKNELMSINDIDFPWLSEQVDYIMQGTGKGMRPALTLLAGKSFEYDLTYLLPMAVSVELMHTATLVHDDAIDKAATRRGQTTINELWGEEIAILMGDFLFAKAGGYVADTQSIRAVKIFTETLAIISSGEINQYLSAFKLNQTRDDYFHRIASKTASLFSLSTESGAILSRAPEASITAMRDYGHNLGVAFQIVDDILDFVSTEETLGKPVGSDLAQGTLTLPAILLLERFPEDNPVRNIFGSRGENAEKEIEKAIKQIRESSIVKDCYDVAAQYCASAVASLKSLPDNIHRQVLTELAEFVLSRRD
ncbi:polyprenyl synthetase family protein [Chloroflexota bacterium]